jgi:hypothetical protein
MNSDEWGSVNPFGQARASAFEIAISRFDSYRPGHPFSRSARLPKKRGMAGNPGSSHIRFGLWTLGSPVLRWKSRKVSSCVREYSRFAETAGGDRLITTAA